MGLDFLKQHGARRMSDYQAQPMLLNGLWRGATALEDDDETDDAAPSGAPRKPPNVQLTYERSLDEWAAIRVSQCGRWDALDDWELRPQRFVDGKDVGRTVAWLRTEEGFPVPIRLSTIGAIAMRNEAGRLTRDWCQVRRVVSLATDCFSVDDILAFQDALAPHSFELLSVPCPPEGLGFDFERTDGRTRKRSRYEMNTLEKQAMQHDAGAPLLVDGRLDAHNGAFDPVMPVTGLVKSHHVQYLENEPRAWQVLYDLEPGERTPAFVIKNPNGDVVSWYVRLCGTDGAMPNWGVARLEWPLPFFENTGRDWPSVDKLSQLICEYRCRNEDYGRAAVSIHPIVRAEESLGALFTPLDTLVHRFYRLTNL